MGVIYSMKKMRLDLQFFASGSFELNKGTGNANWKSLQGKIVWSSVSNGSEANTSTVTTQLWVRTWTGGTSERNWPGSVKVGSNTAHTFSDMGADWADKWIGDTYVLFKTYTDIVKHNDDGTCKITISASITGPNGTSLAGVTSSGSKEVILDTIPRASSLDSFSGSKRIGVANDVIINFTKKSSKFTTTLAYATKEDLSDLTTIVDKSTNASTYSWTIPINLLNKIPNSKTLDIYVMLATFDGNTQIGTAQTNSFTAYVYEDNCRPVWNTHTIEETDATAKQLVTTANKFIANLSKPKFTFEATGQYGATIKYYQVNNTTRTSGFTDSAFNTNGYTIKVVDSRGVTNTYTFTTTYVPYFTPIFEEVKLFRDTPTSNKVFSYFKIKFFNNTSDVKFDNSQALSYKFNYQEAGGTAQEILITPETYDIETSRYAENETELGSSFNYKKSVDWTFFFVDLTGKTFKTENTLPMGIPLMNGKMNEDGEQELYVNGKLTVDSNVVSRNLFNDKKIILTSNSSITYTDDSFTISSNGYWGYGEYFTTLPAGTYTLSGNVSGNVDFIELYINGAWINGKQPFTFNLDIESEIRIVLYATTGEHSSGSTTFSKVQLEKGTTTTDFVPYLNLNDKIQQVNKYLPGSHTSGPFYTTNYLQLGYIKCDLVEWADWSNITLLISSSFYGIQHWSTHLLTLAQANYVKASLLKVGGHDRTFFYKKDETNKRIYLYASCWGGNGYGDWNTTLQNNINCEWVEEVVYDVEYDSSTWFTIEDIGRTTYNSLVVNEEKVYAQDLSYKITKINGMVFVNIYSVGFKTIINNGDLLFYGLPKPKIYTVFMMFGSNNSSGKTVRCALTNEGQVLCHWGGTDSYGDSANKQFSCMFMYEAVD
jgi:hypothetical protein